jgi:phosphoribosylformimino-5-aminoimidazole carboxamide ribotide isomerase
MSSAQQGVRLIPVIDLLAGQVVRGRGGDRQAYRPIISALCASHEPLTVARILCRHCQSPQLYLADLDALMGGAVQCEVIVALLQALPGIELWLDAGFAGADGAHALLARLGAPGARVVPVFGSESLRSLDGVQGFGGADGRAVLSLDRRGAQRLDAAACWDAPARWPQRVIVMTMERVGSGAGPDLQTLAELHRRAPQATLIGAGGVRSEADLALAQQAGADAWLVASALHDLQIPARVAPHGR